MSLSRRHFVAILGNGAASLAWPRAVEALARRLQAPGPPDDEEFWRLVRSAFLIPDDRIYLNNGTLGPSPRLVVDAVAEHARRVAMTYPPGVAWDDLKRALGEFLAADPEGFVIPRNTTEAMSFVAHGLELAEGDEILTTDHEHIGGVSAWELVAERRGADLLRASLPVPAPSSGALLDAVWSRVTERTRVVMVSHVTFTNGTALPVADLARRCADRGIIFVVDGAHPPGMLRVALRDIAADFYASSPHKWLLAPPGTGLLHLAPPWRTELWPTLASGGWDDVDLGAHRLNHMGTLDESRMAGLLAAVEFQRAVGPDRIEARVRYLQEHLRGALEGIPGLELMTPAAEELGSGMLSFHLEGVESLALQRHLAQAANIRTRVIGEYDLGWMRLSTHVYNLPSALDRTAELIDEVARSGL